MAHVWTKAYTEIAKRINDNLTSIQWIDLWHNQAGFLESEHPFPTPAVFLAFRSLGDPEDLGELVQKVNFQVDMYLFYETFLDTYNGAYNQDTALQFLDSQGELYQLFHGFSGASFNNLRRVAFRPVDTGSAGNLYVQSFTGILFDELAKRNHTEQANVKLGIEKGVPNSTPSNDFIVPTT